MRSERGGRRSLPAKLLIALGVAAQIAAALALWNTGAVIEFAAPAPTVRQSEAKDGKQAKAESGLEEKIEALEGVNEALADGAAALSMSGAKSAATVSAEGESAEASLCCVEPRWLEIFPRQIASGRWMDDTELQRGTKVAVLDEDLAFALFGSEVAEEREISIEGENYRVIGTVRHKRSVGEADPCRAYLPLRAAAKQGIQLDTIAMHALSAVSAGLGQSMDSAAREAWGPGELHDLQKERMGALLLSRLILCAFGLALAFRLGRKFAVLTRRWRTQIAERRRHAYLKGWLGMAVARILGALLGAAALLAATYAILSFAIAPVYRFTEWVPESLVSVKAIRTVFWSRAAEAAKLLSIRTPQSARIAFWGAMDRIGATSLLLGLALGRKKLLPPQANSGTKD